MSSITSGIAEQYGDSRKLAARGDFVIEVRPVSVGAWAIMSGHRGSPRLAPEASPPAIYPSRQTRSALSL